MRQLLTDYRGNPIYQSNGSWRRGSTMTTTMVLSSTTTATSGGSNTSSSNLSNNPLYNPQSLLFLHVASSDWNAVIRRASSHPKEVLMVDDNCNTPLHRACQLDPPVNVVTALRDGVTHINALGATPLHIAASHRCNPTTIHTLIEFYRGALRHQSRMGRTPIHYACMSYRGLDLIAFQTLLEATLEESRNILLIDPTMTTTTTIDAEEGEAAPNEVISTSNDVTPTLRDDGLPVNTSHSSSGSNHHHHHHPSRGREPLTITDFIDVLRRQHNGEHGSGAGGNTAVEDDVSNILDDEELSVLVVDDPSTGFAHMSTNDTLTFVDEDEDDDDDEDENNPNKDNPNIVTWKDSTGNTPLSLLFRRYRERVKSVITVLEQMRNNPTTSNPPTTSPTSLQTDLGHLWGKARLIVARLTEEQQQQKELIQDTTATAAVMMTANEIRTTTSSKGRSASNSHGHDRSGSGRSSSSSNIRPHPRSAHVHTTQSSDDSSSSSGSSCDEHLIAAAEWGSERCTSAAAAAAASTTSNATRHRLVTSRILNTSNTGLSVVSSRSNSGNGISNSHTTRVTNEPNSVMEQGADRPVVQQQQQQRQFRIVHASVALAGYGCPPEMIRLAISIHPHQVKEMDEDGNLPLHIAATAASYGTISTGTCVSDDVSVLSDGMASLFSSGSSKRAVGGAGNSQQHNASSFEKVIKLLLKHYPQAAQIPHGKSGRLPLALAVRAGNRSWGDGMKALLRAYPPALFGGSNKGLVPITLYPHVLCLIGGGNPSAPNAPSAVSPSSALSPSSAHSVGSNASSNLSSSRHSNGGNFKGIGFLHNLLLLKQRHIRERMAASSPSTSYSAAASPARSGRLRNPHGSSHSQRRNVSDYRKPSTNTTITSRKAAVSRKTTTTNGKDREGHAGHALTKKVNPKHATTIFELLRTKPDLVEVGQLYEAEKLKEQHNKSAGSSGGKTSDVSATDTTKRSKQKRTMSRKIFEKLMFYECKTSKMT